LTNIFGERQGFTAEKSRLVNALAASAPSELGEKNGQYWPLVRPEVSEAANEIRPVLGPASLRRRAGGPLC
jgi:hypothetical protein